MAPSEPGIGQHGGQDNLPEALIPLHPIDGSHRLPEAVHRPTIVPLGTVGVAEVQVHQRVQDDITVACRKREGTLGGVERLVIRSLKIEIVGQKGRDVSQSTRIVEGFREGLSLTQRRQDAPKAPRGQQCRAQGESEINGQLACVALRWQVGQDAERLLVIAFRLAVDRPCQGLFPRLLAVCQRLLPHLTPERVVREPFGLL
jgi:hypothetical protein